MSMSIKFAKSYERALFCSAILQVAFLSLCVMRWREFTARMFLAACACYWLVALAVMLARPRSPSAWAVFSVAAGFVAWFLAAFFVFPFFFNEYL